VIQYCETYKIDLEKIGYQTKIGKEYYTLDEFLDAMERYYSLTPGSTKVSHFFRSNGAQTKFRVKEKLKENDAADHILSTALFREIIRYYGKDIKQPYDVWSSIKTIINQCWNFQNITKKANTKKSFPESAWVKKLKDKKLQPIPQNCIDLAIEIRSSIDNSTAKKKLFCQAIAIRDCLNGFFCGLFLTTYQ
jgi:hypothetical protein